MENPTASETTQATSPAPYPIMVPSSTVVAWAARGAMAVAKAAIAAAFGLNSTLASVSGITTGALNAGLVLDGVEKAEQHAMMAAKKKASWKVFMMLIDSF